MKNILARSMHSIILFVHTGIGFPNRNYIQKLNRDAHSQCRKHFHSHSNRPDIFGPVLRANLLNSKNKYFCEIRIPLAYSTTRSTKIYFPFFSSASLKLYFICVAMCGCLDFVFYILTKRDWKGIYVLHTTLM